VDVLEGGGGVMWGVFEPVGDAARIHREGVVLDSRGKPVTSFTLPSAIWKMGQVVIGKSMYVLGFPAEGVIRETETEGWSFLPGSLVGYQIDLDSGVVRDFSIPGEPQGSVGDQTDQVGLFQVAGEILLIVGGEADAAWHAWTGGIDGKWTAVDAPTGMPCQVGQHVVVREATMRGDEGDPTAPPAVVDATDVRTAAPSVRVFDAKSGAWGPVSTGPRLTSSAVAAPPEACSGTRLSIFTLSPNDMTVASFDPSTADWTEKSIPHGYTPVAMAMNGVSNVLLSSSSAETKDAVYDPVSGKLAPLEISLRDVAALVPVEKGRVLLIGKRADGDRRLEL